MHAIVLFFSLRCSQVLNFSSLYEFVCKASSALSFLQLPRTLNHKSLGKNIVADLLDSLMVLTFEHLESCANNKRLGEVFSEATFVQILSHLYVVSV